MTKGNFGLELIFTKRKKSKSYEGGGARRIYIRVPCFCYEGLPLVSFWRFYCINLVYELISPLIDNTVQQATHLFIILLKTKKLKIVEDDIFNALVQTPTRVQRP